MGGESGRILGIGFCRVGWRGRRMILGLVWLDWGLRGRSRGRDDWSGENDANVENPSLNDLSPSLYLDL